MEDSDILKSRFYRCKRLARTTSERVAFPMPSGITSVYWQTRRSIRNQVVALRRARLFTGGLWQVVRLPLITERQLIARIASQIRDTKIAHCERSCCYGAVKFDRHTV